MKQNTHPERPDDMTGKHHDRQGTDKAPGEETSKDTTTMASDTQKGKKVDADPSRETDRPAEQR